MTIRRMVSDMPEFRTERGAKKTETVSEDFKIVNKLGMHARAAVLFIKAAGAFQSEIRVTKDGVEVNGKSIMGILMLGAARGNTITVTASGPEGRPTVMALEAPLLARLVSALPKLASASSTLPTDSSSAEK